MFNFRLLFPLLSIFLFPLFALGESELKCGNDTCPKRRSCELMLVAGEATANISPLNFLSFETQATEVIRKVMLSNADAEIEVDLWSQRLEQRISRGERFSVMEHLALVYIAKKGVLEIFPNKAIRLRVFQMLLASWSSFSLEKKQEDQLLERLPRSVLAEASDREKLFHSAIFQETIDSSNSLFAGLKKRLAFFKDYIPTANDKVLAIGLLAFSFSETGGPLIAGAIMGYLINTIAEHSIHKHIGHASSQILKLKDNPNWSWLGKVVSRNWFSHSPVHHGLSGKSHDLTKLPEEEFQKMLDRVRAKEPEALEMIERGDFGVTLKTPGIIGGMALVAPVYLATMWALNLGPEAIAGIIATSWLHVGASKYLHPYLHKSQEEALKKASPPMRWFLTSRYGQMIMRHHYVHHKSAKVNFNLVFGADWLLGSLQNPSLEQIFQMSDYHLIGASWEE